MSDDQTHPPDPPEEPLDPAVTPVLFQEWRARRFGRSNPERMNNPVWEWLVRSKLDAYLATQRLHGPSAFEAGPGWCFDRFGQSSTDLRDGRVVLIAGEHEDYYDPDFCIYNDVVVRHPNGKMDIFGYERRIFPPTDFHTATLAGDRLIIIGCLGYREDRRPGTTPVMVLDLDAFAIAPVPVTGAPPGWLHKHQPTLSEDGATILVQGGKLDRGRDDGSLVENIDDWRLHLADGRWERLTERRWQRWEIVRRDRKPNHLWGIQQALWHREVRWDKEFREQMEQLNRELGREPNLDLMATLYQPGVPHEQRPAVESEYRVLRISVEGITVRYVEDMRSIQLTVEGELPQQIVDVLTSDLLGKMIELENAPCDLKPL